MTNKSIRDYINLIENAQREGVAEGSEEKDPIWNKGTPMPKNYTCPCGIHVHPSVKKPGAIHAKDCPYAKKPGVAEEQLEETSPEAIAKISQITRR